MLGLLQAADAFKKFVKSIPPGSGMAYILVQHLHPDHNSALPEILQRETSIPVIEVTDNIEVAPDMVYIIPANKMLSYRWLFATKPASF